MAQKKRSGSSQRKKTTGKDQRPTVKKSAPSAGKTRRGSTAAKKTTPRKPVKERTPKVRKIRQVKPPRERYQRQKGKHSLIYGIVSAVIILAALVVGSMVFFEVETITAAGTQRYSQEQIVSACGIEEGENLFLLDKEAAAERLQEKLPYLRDIVIRRRLPGSVIIQVEESSPVAALEVANGWWYMDEEGRLLEFADDPGLMVQVSGLNLLAPRAGSELSVAADYQLRRDSLVGLLAAMDAQGIIDRAETIDLSSGTQILMKYDQRFTVKIQFGADFDYKMRAMAGMIEKLSPNDKGVIDLTMDTEWHFIPD